MKVNGKDKKSIWMDGLDVTIIDQRLGMLPHVYHETNLATYEEVCTAIKDMWVSGAGLIGATAGYGMAVAARQLWDDKCDAETLINRLEVAKEALEHTRPTAQNLFYATNRIFDKIVAESKGGKMKAWDIVVLAREQAHAIAFEDADNCYNLGRNGSPLLRDGARVMTHCNAGWLAFVDWGSATGPIYAAHREGKDVFVYVSETRPRLQGSNLTAWELGQEGVDHVIIPDNASGALMREGLVDIVIVGADRIAANGDTANKIGTYMKALAAKANNVPFYVAAPSTTFDFSLDNGDKIPIERRDPSEVLNVDGLDESGDIKRVRIAPKNSKAENIAFDVTPHDLITGYITEKGVFNAGELEEKLK